MPYKRGYNAHIQTLVYSIEDTSQVVRRQRIEQAAQHLCNRGECTRQCVECVGVWVRAKLIFYHIWRQRNNPHAA